MDRSKQRQSEKRETGAKRPGQRQASKPAAALPDLKQAFASPPGVLSLQRAIGNRAVNRLVENGLQSGATGARPNPSAPLPSAPRAGMSVGPPDDAYEQQADRVAKHVVRAMSGQTAPQPPLPGPGAITPPPPSAWPW